MVVYGAKTEMGFMLIGLDEAGIAYAMIINENKRTEHYALSVFNYIEICLYKRYYLDFNSQK